MFVFVPFDEMNALRLDGAACHAGKTIIGKRQGVGGFGTGFKTGPVHEGLEQRVLGGSMLRSIRFRHANARGRKPRAFCILHLS